MDKQRSFNRHSARLQMHLKLGRSSFNTSNGTNFLCNDLQSASHKISKISLHHQPLGTVTVHVYTHTHIYIYTLCPSQWLHVVRRRYAATRLRMWVCIPLGACILSFICCECCVLSRRGFCNKLITNPESYQLWCVIVCDLETSRMSRPWPALGHSSTGKQNTHTHTHT
jgi:hypothetical protein